MAKKDIYQRKKKEGDSYRLNSNVGESATEYRKRIRKIKRDGFP